MRAAGHTILHDITVDILAASHIAIVGPSGAGKSSLVGLLLGWSKPARGQVLIDGHPVSECLEDLRRHTAWVDPAVQLWNKSFLENVRYGTPEGYTDDKAASMLQVLDAADLRRVLERLPDGFESRLGEGGALVSGGEGQRVRLARGLLRPATRLAILDEPFRGLDRDQRNRLLQRVLALWKGVTVLCITHDVIETLGFTRVLVIEDGTIVEDGSPPVLAALPASRYRALLDAEYSLRETLWSGNWSVDRSLDGSGAEPTGKTWRRYRLEDATLTNPQPEQPA